MTSRHLTAALLLALCAVPARSQFRAEEVRAARQDPKRFTIDESTIKIEKLGPASVFGRTASGSALEAEPGEGLPALDQIINTALKVWKIIVENRPVVDVKTQFAVALPKGVSGWQELAGWRPPEGTVYQLTAKNLYGMQTVNVRYQVVRTYGGSYNGAGRYLTAVTVEPLLVETDWGYHLSVDASVPDTSVDNVGTAQEPVAGMMVQLAWHIATPVRDSQGTGVYYVQGDGVYRELGGPFVNSGLEKAKAKMAALGVKPVRFE